MERDGAGGLDWRLSSIARLAQPNEKKILFVVIDGLGGLPHPAFVEHGPLDEPGQKTPKSELEWASLHGKLENLNAFVRDPKTVTGRIYPVGKGFTPGSVAGHLGLFGYDPEHYFVQRGPAEAAALPGVTEPGDVIARLNFCSVAKDGKIVDRRAGRMKDPSRGAELAERINKDLRVEGAHVRVVATADHRGILILRRTERSDPPLSEHICGTDPGRTGAFPLECQPLHLADKPAMRTAAIVRQFTGQVREILSGEGDANMILLRGFGTRPALPHFADVYNVRAAAIAAYPVYRGVANLVGMTILDRPPGGKPLSIADEFGPEVDVLKVNHDRFDFFYLHYKKTDEKGEDGDYLGKVDALHAFDVEFSRIRELGFHVIVVTGDHSTPSLLGRHSHHSVPLAIYSEVMEGCDRAREFTESSCLQGMHGVIDGPELMAIVLGNAGKLRKFGE